MILIWVSVMNLENLFIVFFFFFHLDILPLVKTLIKSVAYFSTGGLSSHWFVLILWLYMHWKCLLLWLIFLFPSGDFCLTEVLKFYVVQLIYFTSIFNTRCLLFWKYLPIPRLCFLQNPYFLKASWFWCMIRLKKFQFWVFEIC